MADAVKNFLLKPENHLQELPIDYIETHISEVYLTDERVFKRKKPLKLDFLDYSNLEQRRLACEQEIKLNRRLAPLVYLEVKPLYQTPSGISWTPSCEEDVVSDWLVEMKRLPENKMLDRLLLKKELPNDLELKSLVRLLVDFYRSNRRESIDVEKWIENLHTHLLDNEEALFDFLPQEKTRILKLSGYQKAFLFIHKNWFRQRIYEGYVCDGHGDLKPEHVCMTKPPVIYDCIEFDPMYRLNDIADELAFFALECEYLGNPELIDKVALKVLNEFSGDKHLPVFYLCYRACVRAKIEAMKASVLEDSQLHFTSAVRYLELAESYFEKYSKPNLILIGGFIGSGKSTLARDLANQIGSFYLQSDQVRLDSQGDQARTPENFAKGDYLYEKRLEVYKKILDMAAAALTSGRDVIVDASFVNYEFRQIFYELSSAKSYHLSFIWVNCPDEIAEQRLRRRLDESSISAGRVDTRRKQIEFFEGFKDSEEVIVVDSSGTPMSNLSRLEKLLSSRQP